MEVVDYQKEYEIGVCGHRWVSSQLEESNDPHQVEQWFAFHIPYSSSCSSPVIKVYDPISDTWESLPSPLPVPPFSVRMYAALESKQQIVVALHCDPKSRNFSTLFIYNISNRCWTKLAHHFGVHHTPPLLHLADQKFCIFLHSTNRKHTFHHNKEGIKHDYLNCLIFEISPPIFDHDKDKDNSTDPDHSSILCISIVSVHKFPFHDKLSFHDSSLLDQTKVVK
ncbi:hypothetical protein RGQ29_019973 [Quercus rubra]|uniref:Uncharacterized protein n=1 Tax=Quercus rubra TaxID=3512 RepID=A0AAN7IPE9_QUERU|nr:hypothetical protein RGQ29_019973 [Quercus rubra]